MYICLDGNFILESDKKVLRVPALSTAMQFCSSVFETLRTYNSTQVFEPEAHLERLYKSAEILKISPCVGAEEIREKLQELVQKNALSGKDLRIKIFLAEDFYWIRCQELEEMPLRWYAKGVEVDDTVHERAFPQAKYPSPAYQHFASIRPKECWETLCFTKDEHLREGVISNVMAVFDGTIVTPKRGVLLGVTRAHVLQVAQDCGYKTQEREITRKELEQADEIFLTLTSKGVVSVQKWRNWERETFPVADRLRERFLG